jgi:hypothetical protein
VQDPALRVFVSSSPLLKLKSLPYGHMLVDNAAESDVLFIWVQKADSIKPAFDLGAAIALEKHFCIASYSVDTLSPWLDRLPAEILVMCQSLVYGNTFEEAYRRGMQTIPNNLHRKDIVVASGHHQYQCYACQGEIKPGDRVHIYGYLVNSLSKKVLHRDCHELRVNPSKVDSAIFNSRLVEALRADNAALEARIRELEATEPKRSRKRPN